MKKDNGLRATGMFIALLIAGCAQYPANPRLDSYNPKTGYRFGNIAATARDDSTFIVLTFSGGGTRAAAFAFGVLEELHRTPHPTTAPAPTPGRTMLDEVDVISSVSGGSFTAAYYGLNRDGIFTDPEFRDRLLYHNVEEDLALSVLNPLIFPRLLSPAFSRIDMAAEYYDRALYHKKTFADLAAKKQRPFVVINATDMSLGSRFEFTQNAFDLLRSNLDTVHVARAVAASSAFPYLLSPLTLNNYAKEEYGPPAWVNTTLANDFDKSPRRWQRAHIVDSYFDTDRPYIHLVDGGIADNIGLRGIETGLEFPDTLSLTKPGLPEQDDGDLNIQRMLNAKKIRRLVFIIADAQNVDSNKRDLSPHTPGIFDVGEATASAPMGNYSFETVQLLQDYCEARNREHVDPAMGNVKAYVIHLRFDAIQDGKMKHYLQNLGTNYDLPKKAVDDLRTTSALLLRNSPIFQSLLHDLSHDTPATQPVN